jgi:uncharacterized oligopeptide transporter (OPT) family protein
MSKVRVVLASVILVVYGLLVMPVVAFAGPVDSERNPVRGTRPFMILIPVVIVALAAALTAINRRNKK